ncbi:NAD-dependent succinate-semialdehyde dehydrogenase [Mesorhizobium sp.]|uniref:NAD-dependent succinate-semialdehyde dehydrogenase n=1 Tax=Mesorhizobium sp. TaxID=1871066 RepID=UPI00356803DB
MHGLNDGDLFRQTCLIDGVWQAAAGEATIPVFNPATGEELGHVPDCGDGDTRRAIASAAAALGPWKARTAAARAAVLERWHALVLQHAEDLARILTLEQGKPLAEARGEIAYGNAFIKWFAEEARRVSGATIPSPSEGRRILVTKEAVGVCAIVTPWNFPTAMITRKVAPALAAGCTVVIKPSDLTPYSALALAVLGERAGIPPGVVNVVTGMPQAIGAELTANQLVRKLSFTGSTRVGSMLARQCADSVKRLSLELGGNAPFIVFEDADLDAAVEGAMAAKFRNGGQTCVCANRILVHHSVYEPFAERLSARVAALRVGDGLHDGVDIGPMINSAAVDKIAAHVADALDKGASVASPAIATPPGALFVTPMVLRDATTEMVLSREETFGPVAPLFRFRTEAEAVAMANDTPFGLAAYFYTRDLSRAFRVGEALEFGMVGLNTGLISTEVAPFGGIKQSGLGREGSYLGMDEYLEVKTLHLGGIESAA